VAVDFRTSPPAAGSAVGSAGSMGTAVDFSSRQQQILTAMSCRSRRR